MSALTKFKKGDTVPVTVSRKNGTFTAKVTF